MFRRQFLQLFALLGAFASGTGVVLARPLRVSTGSWLEVRLLKGKVTHQRGDRSWRAWKGMRFNTAGDVFETGKNASAVLALQSGIGTIHVAEQTKFTIVRMETTSNGGIVTCLDVVKGQVSLKVRPFKNPASKLEIRTPAGVAGVRGTEFGVGIQPSGQTGLATRSGLVAATAEGQTVDVAKANQCLMVPQSPPTAAVALRDDPGLYLDVARTEGSQIRLIGKIDPVNLMLIEDIPQNTDREGRFDLLVAQWRGNAITVKVITPLGTKKQYGLPVIF